MKTRTRPKLYGTHTITARVTVYTVEAADQFLEAFAPGARKSGSVEILSTRRSRGKDNCLLTIRYRHTAANMSQNVDGEPSGKGDGDYNARRFLQEAAKRSGVRPLRVPQIDVEGWVPA